MGNDFYSRYGLRESFGVQRVLGLEPPEARSFLPAWRRGMHSPALHCLLFLLTIVTTLAVGAHMAMNCEQGYPAFDWDFSWTFFTDLWRHPSLLLLGIPFSFTLLSILLAHEFGHYFTCRFYGIRATYPYFIPAPTLIGTLGAFIRIKTPITTRRALFDVGISGPLAGAVIAIPALAVAILKSRGAAPVSVPDTISLGSSLMITGLGKILRHGMSPASIFLHPIGCAAWVGLFATTLNLLPIGQLDGGHIVYAVLGERHRTISRGLFLALVPLGIICWAGWMVWAAVLLIIGLRHPAVMIPAQPLDRGRKALALVAALLFLLTFVPTPFVIH